MSEHIVALRYTAAANGHAGIVTWTPFPSKQEFDDWFKNIGHKEQEVVEEGITEERAIELCQTTPLRSYVRAAITESTDPDTGRVNHDMVQSRLGELTIVFESRRSQLLSNR